jgi:hypothetical protein
VVPKKNLSLFLQIDPWFFARLKLGYSADKNFHVQLRIDYAA